MTDLKYDVIELPETEQYETSFEDVIRNCVMFTDPENGWADSCSWPGNQDSDSGCHHFECPLVCSLPDDEYDDGYVVLVFAEFKLQNVTTPND